MLQIKRKGLSLLCACTLLVGLAPSQVFGAVKQDKAEAETEMVQDVDLKRNSAAKEIMEQAADNGDAFAVEEGQELAANEESKPKTFDLRHVKENGTEKNYVTPVRQQSPFGTCWGFGAIAAAESSILSSGLSDDPAGLNLSEKQVAWFTNKELEDAGNAQNGEGIVYDAGVKSADRYNTGGFTLYATNLFASGIGPMSENTSTEDEDIFRYKGKNGKSVRSYVDWYEGAVLKEGWQKTYYSDDDDWAIPEKYRFSQDYRLKESYLLPSPSVLVSERPRKVEYHPEATEAIKDQLLNKRAVCVSVYADHSQPGDASDSHFGDGIWAQYGEDSDQTHVVTIVGYDDTFPKELFNKNLQPPENGAWLVKNSWGADTNDFPDNGYSHWGLKEGEDRVGGPYEATSRQATGYYWLSYYDKSIVNPEAYTFEAVPGEERFINQHDYMPVMKYDEYSTDSKLMMGNVFRAEQNGKIEDISFFTTTPGTTVTFKIMLLEDGWTNPDESGYCVYESSPKTYEYGGYHREEINQDDIIIGQKQDYVVIVEEKTPSGKYSISLGEALKAKDKDHQVHSVINAKESILYMGGEMEGWIDVSNANLQKILLGEKANEMTIDNFPIKVGLSPVDSKGFYLKLENRKNVDANYVKVTEEHRYAATIDGGSGDLPVTPQITWKASDPELFSVKTEKGGSQAVVTGKNPGYGILVVDAGIYGKKVLSIQVSKLGLTYVYLGDHIIQEVYDGKAHTPEVVDVFGDTTEAEGRWGLIKDQDYTVAYQDNISCGKGLVTVTGQGLFKGSENGWFVIVPAKPKINKVTAGANEMTVSFESQQASGISGYILSYKESGTDQIKTMKVAADQASAVISGLTAGKTYDVSLKAYVTIDEDGQGSMVLNRETYDFPEERGPVDYFGQESDVVTSGKITEKGKDDGSNTGKPSDGSVKDPTSVAGTSKKIQKIKKDGDLAGSRYSKLRLLSRKTSNTGIRLNWKKVSGADGYIIYGNRCGTKYKMKKLAECSGARKTYVVKKRKKGTYYKLLIVAYKVKGGTKKVVASSKTIHVATTGGKVGNPKAVKLNKTRLTLKKGKTARLKATAIAKSKKKTVKRHAPIRFESSNTKIATVNKKGKITAKKKGTCYIYAYAQNGVAKRAKVTVK